MRSRRLGALAAVALALAGAASSEQEGRPALLGSGRVALAPLNLGVRAVAEITPGLGPVQRALAEVLAAESSPVIAIDAGLAARWWSEVAAGVGARRDPLERLSAARARFARRAAAELGIDTIVFAALITRRARLQGYSVKWDGTSRTVDVPGQEYEEVDALRDGPLRISRSGARGQLAAVSLHVEVMSAQGAPRFTGTGGLVLLQEVVPAESATGDALEVRYREDPFGDEEELREGVHTAFR